MSARSFQDSSAAFLRSPEGMLIRRLGLVLAMYTVVRVVFLVDHRANFDEVPASALALAFLRGLRFDLSAIVYSNIPFILLSLAPVALLTRRWYALSMHAVFAVVNGAAAIVMVGDVGYYPFTGTRVTMDVFALSGEASAQFGQLMLHFAGLASVAVILALSMLLLYPRQRAGSPVPARSGLRAALGVFAVLVCTALAARGGLQKKPLKPIHAFASGNHEVGVLTLNSAFTLIHSPRDQKLAPVHFFADDRDAEALLRAPYGLPALDERPAGPQQNVMLLILESFGTEYWGGESREVTGLTPFLDSLAGAGIFLTNSFANGRRSMDALPSMLVGVPLYSGRSIAVSSYQQNEWRGLGHFLGDAGYHASMFHGAVRGTMFFDAIAAMAGIGDFYPLERFPSDLRSASFDGSWGLFDEAALQFVAHELGTHREPWFTTAFTISTHHPYTVPEEYVGSLPSGPRPIHQNVAYVDLAVRRFFETARTQPWFDNTLFVITGDHTAPMRSDRYDTVLGRYMVPVLLYHPTRPLPEVDRERVVQHVDLFATILDFAGVRPSRLPLFGRSIFSSAPGEALIAADETYWLVRAEGVVERQPDGRERVLAYQREATGQALETLSPERTHEFSERLSAYVQHYTMSMINNSFYRDPAVRTAAISPIGRPGGY